MTFPGVFAEPVIPMDKLSADCLLYTSDAADERSSVDLGGRRIIKKKKAVDIDLLAMSLALESMAVRIRLLVAIRIVLR